MYSKCSEVGVADHIGTQGSDYAFALVMVDVPDVDEFKELQHELNRDREPWMAHYLRRHIINLYCDENFRKRARYDAWADKWLELRRL